jgi:type IV conjugative transfer system protein TraE
MTVNMANDIQIQIENMSIKRQRNFFAGCLSLALISSFLLSAKLSLTREKIIMVPGISKDMSIDGNDVSISYLEETSLLFISALLDLTPTTVSAKRDIILKHASKRSPASLKSLQEYFAVSELEYKKFQLSTFFAPKALHVDPKALQVIVDGVLSTTFGKRGFEEKIVQYKLSFDYVGGHLQLKEFVELKKIDEKNVDTILKSEAKSE